MIYNSDSTFSDTTVCNVFVWGDSTYTESGVYTQDFENINECDSTHTVNLIVNYSDSTFSDTTVCDAFIWDGDTLTISNSYTKLYSNINGCDSTHTYNLTVNESTTGTDTQESCDEFTWIDGITYTESTDSATFVLINSVGCDSTVILDLTIINSSSSTANVIACDSYFWNNELYTESGIYTLNTLNVEGCDSTAILNLTINGASTSIDYVSTCDAYQWNGEIYFESGTYIYNSIDIFGCDSIATLELEICTLEELIIDGINNVDTESSVTYSVQENLGSTYFWTISNLGFISSGQFTNEIIVDWSILEGNSTICVTESKNCFGLDCEGDTYCTNVEVKDVVGIEDISSDFVEIYPNPSRGIFNVSIQLNNLQNVSLELVNSLGELVSDKNLGESKGELNESFDLSNQPSGIYLLRILLDDKLITRKVTLN